ncbi:M13 family metallopeptidase [Limnoglobus roseus]|uniref:Neutral endopeptidase n=1 Tax=Limnoglobus roseus TaxID=2598579 RepID=A0A5C1ABE9_9BACT|nr:M13-type metalloendopeptidase [Limnoglobus roseus]QEL16571.1 Neutral endopeptidase [Limnoglobus roseus]
MKASSVAAFALVTGLVTAFAAEPSPKSGIDKKTFDSAVRPQDDLYRSVNGKWLKESEIPGDRPADGAFFELRDRSEERVRAILEDAVKGKGGADAQKIADLYASFLDEARANQLGLTPIQPELDAIAAIKDKARLVLALADLQRTGVPGLFGLYVSTDAKQSDQYTTYLEQGGLSLPNESYYREAKYDDLRKSYVAHVGKMLALAKVPAPDKAAAQILAVETAIAKGHWDNVRTRDADQTYNKFTRDGVKALIPGLDLDPWFDRVGSKAVREVVVREPSFLTDLAKTLDTFPIADWKTYLTWRVVSSRAPLLSEPFVAEDFAFSGKTLLGTPEMQPRWKRGVALVEGALGEAVGKLYVEKHFPPAAKDKMKVLVANLIEAYRVDIQALDWMSAETKAKALQKLAKFTPKIGYPDQWRDYSKLEVKPDDLVGNRQRAAAFALDYQLGKLGQRVDRNEWHMTPQTVNAYYNPGMNEIVFPAAILQPPFFDPTADDAVNYGGIGAVIGHEIGHGFDDQGAKYDGDGNLKDWWTADDKKEFQKRTRALVQQYNAFQPQQLPGQSVNGALTIGENIGDLGGLTIAHKAYTLSLKGTAAPSIDGWTGPQRFFFGWAQVWRAKYRDAALSRRLATDPHSPPEFRCNGVIRNLTEFYDAFGVKEGDKLWLPAADRVRIW